MGKRNKLFSSLELEIRNELNCQHCGKEFKYESERKRHEQSHSPQFICKVCHKKFGFMSALRRHKKQHERMGSVCCGQCNRKFRDESLLKRHMKYAHKGTFSCVQCNAIFNSDLALHSHMKTHKPESERKYRCSFVGCTKSFNFTHHLKHHELTHTNTKQFFCAICGKGFIQYHHLKNHTKIHKPDSSLLCSFPGCQKTFATEITLRKHAGTHKICNIAPSANVDLRGNAGIETIQNDCNDFADIDAKSLNDPDFIKSDTERIEDWREKYLVKLDNVVDNHLDLNANEDLSLLQKVDSLDLNEAVPISNCKSSLGGCIMGEVGSNKCLCAQIQPSSILTEDTYELAASGTSVSPIKTNVDEVELKAIKLNNIGCSNDFSFDNINNTVDSGNLTNEIIDFKSDGTIKIKSSFDTDVIVPVFSSSESTNLNNGTVNTSASYNIPFNSCKDILGKCIVSGNGIISEGCLCAKMALDNQEMLDQEINELTPCPKG